MIKLSFAKNPFAHLKGRVAPICQGAPCHPICQNSIAARLWLLTLVIHSWRGRSSLRCSAPPNKADLLDMKLAATA